MSATSPADEAAIHARIDAIERGFHDRDADATMANYAKGPGALVVFDIAPPLVDIGWAENRAKLETFYAGLDGPCYCRWTDRRLRVGGDIAVVTALLELAAVNVEGTPVESRCRSTLALERRGADWIVVHEHDSLPASFNIPGYAGG